MATRHCRDRLLLDSSFAFVVLKPMCQCFVSDVLAAFFDILGLQFPGEQLRLGRIDIRSNIQVCRKCRYESRYENTGYDSNLRPAHCKIWARWVEEVSRWEPAEETLLCEAGIIRETNSIAGSNLDRTTHTVVCHTCRFELNMGTHDHGPF